MRSLDWTLFSLICLTLACGSPSESRPSDENDLPSRTLGSIDDYHPLALFNPDDVIVVKLNEVDAGNCKDGCGSNEFRVSVGVKDFDAFRTPDVILTTFDIFNLDTLRRRSFLEDKSSRSVFKIKMSSLKEKISKMMAGSASERYATLGFFISLREVDVLEDDFLGGTEEKLQHLLGSDDQPDYSKVLEIVTIDRIFETRASVSFSVQKAEPEDGRDRN